MFRIGQRNPFVFRASSILAPDPHKPIGDGQFDGRQNAAFCIQVFRPVGVCGYEQVGGGPALDLTCKQRTARHVHRDPNAPRQDAKRIGERFHDIRQRGGGIHIKGAILLRAAASRQENAGAQQHGKPASQTMHRILRELAIRTLPHSGGWCVSRLRLAAHTQNRLRPAPRPGRTAPGLR